LDVETNLESFREGGENRYEQQIPGPAKFPSRLVFKRGMTDTSELWTWYQEVIQGLIKRKTVAVFLCDSAGNDRHKWVFRGAVPVKLVGPQLKANASEVALESLELVHKGLLPY
jgi:phage tail-like protein